MQAEPDNRPEAMRLGLKMMRWLVVTGMIFLAAAFGILYGIMRAGGKDGHSVHAAEAGPCANAHAVATKISPLVHGEVAALILAKAPRAMPELSFNGPDGTPTSLAAFRGKAVLLNLWATWCIPCRAEMPALDTLQASEGGDKFEVVAVNIDTARLDKPKAMLNEIGVKTLAFYADPAAQIFQTLRTFSKVQGLPTTILIDPQGCEIGLMAGPAEWASADALALVKAVKGN